MGSSPSQPIEQSSSERPQENTSSTNTDNPSTSTAETKNHKQHTKKDRTGMDLVNASCRKDKRTYNKCVNKWYTKGFITGQAESLHQEDACGELFEAYRMCMLRGIRQEYWEKEGLPPPAESSPLSEVEDET